MNHGLIRLNFYMFSVVGCIVVGSLLSIEMHVDAAVVKSPCELPTNCDDISLEPMNRPGMASNICNIANCEPDSSCPETEKWDQVYWTMLARSTFHAVMRPHNSNGNAGEPADLTINCSVFNDPDNHPDTVFWSYNNKFQLFQNKPGLTRHDDLDPGEWNNPRISKPTREYHGKHYPILGGFSKSNLLDVRLTELFDDAVIDRPLIDRNGNLVLYQIYVNQCYWEWVRNNGYFDAHKQKLDIDQDKFQDSPDGTGQQLPTWFTNLPPYAQQGPLSMKVAWRQLNATEVASNRYYTQKVFYENNGAPGTEDYCGENDGPITIGMVGMHIFRKTPNTGPHVDNNSGLKSGFWMTFEHVDNVNGSSPSFNWNCNAASSGYTMRGGCDNAVADPLTQPWPENGPPPNANVTSNYPNGLCGPQSPGNRSQVFRITESQSNLNANVTHHSNHCWESTYNLLTCGPLAYYQLVGTIQPMATTRNSTQVNATAAFVPPVNDSTTLVNARYLTNTSLEPYSQYNFISSITNTQMSPITSVHERKAMSCINCHAMAAPSGSPLLNAHATHEPSWNHLPDVENGAKQIMTFLLQQAGNSCAPDINLDSTVDLSDLLSSLDHWGPCQDFNCDHDVNQDRVIDIEDLLTILEQWGDCL